jgi:hypothetical protein
MGSQVNSRARIIPLLKVGCALHGIGEKFSPHHSPHRYRQFLQLISQCLPFATGSTLISILATALRMLTGRMARDCSGLSRQCEKGTLWYGGYSS